MQSKQFDDIRTTVDSRLSAIQNDNEHKLEEMRRTVDEKLQGTLEARLGHKASRKTYSVAKNKIVKAETAAFPLVV